MGCKRCCGLLITCSVLLTGICMPAGAVKATENIGDLSCLSSTEWQLNEVSTIYPRATGKVDFTLSAKKTAVVGDRFSLSPGETVTINCSYSPSWADLDFGLIAPDGLFHYVSANGGNINETISVDEWGQYTFAVRNNSSVNVQVVGFVNY
ncbi:MAG: hypothetical protein KH028_07025 [Oscillospiraceae bacterium]|jgi:hypothetical protein|nr:hypothetical protein [Oscillospiraceae bacterium]